MESESNKSDTSKAVNGNENEFFQTAIKAMPDKITDLEDSSSDKPHDTDQAKKQGTMPNSIEKQMSKLIQHREAKPLSPPKKPLSPVYLSRRNVPPKDNKPTLPVPTNVEKEGSSSEGDLTKVLAMRKIAKGLVSMQKTRQQRLEETGNVTLQRKIRMFEPGPIEERMFIILRNRLKNVTYDPARCRLISKSLSEIIRNEVKSMHYPRYKFIVLVSIGQMDRACLMVGSRCMWNSETDTFACSKFKNGSLFAVGQVFAIFNE